MQRRHFLNSALALSATALTHSAVAQAPRPQEFYLLRRYRLETGPETKLTETYLAEALIPALNKAGISPIGAFNVTVGPEFPAIYLLIPTSRLEDVLSIEARLAQDERFLKLAEPFWDAPGREPAFSRIDSSLLMAIDGWPKLTPAPASKPRQQVFQLRTYENPTFQAHYRKITMFGAGEIDIFIKNGFQCLFFADNVIGTRTPSISYMLSFADMADYTEKWNHFLADPAWKKISTDPRYAFEPLVTTYTNILLAPTAFSQI
jgi:hypothetical protein